MKERQIANKKTKERRQELEDAEVGGRASALSCSGGLLPGVESLDTATPNKRAALRGSRHAGAPLSLSPPC